MSPKLSVSIITLNEERDLPGCLESLNGLDAQIVVLDNHSTDRTRELAQAAGAEVSERTFDNYSAQKQAALERTTGEWVLSLDADERITPEFKDEISEILRNPSSLDGFEIPFQVHFMGKRLRFGGLGHETHMRLFRKSKGRFIGGRLHEGIELHGKIKKSKHGIVHIPYRDLDEYLEKMKVYTSNAALKRFDAGVRFHLGYHLLPFWELFHRLILRLGILDGTPGIVWAGLAAYHTWVKYLKLRELELRK
jgi:glycosyltransferase involved in cell wall biosynthesis